MKGQTILRMASGLTMLAMVAVLVIGGGCGSEKASRPTETLQSVYLVDSVAVSPDYLGWGDTAWVAARVVMRDTEQPASGVAVSFGRVGNSAGEPFFRAADTTDSLGVAYGGFIPAEGEVGHVDLKVVAAAAEYAYLSVEIGSGPSQPETEIDIDVIVSETSIPADGESAVDFTLNVCRHSVAAANETITLVAGERFDDRDHDGVFGDADSLLGDVDEDGLWDALGSLPASVTTGSGGSAMATFTAGDVAGTAYIKATLDDFSIDFAIQLYSAESQMQLSTDVVELLADGYATAMITATLLDQDGLAVTGRVVRFCAGEPFNDLDGDGYYTPDADTFTDRNQNGSWDIMGTLSPSASNTDFYGQAGAIFTAGSTVGEVMVYAATQTERGELMIELLELPPVDHAEWFWSSDTLYADGVSTATLNLQLYDLNDAPISGKEVVFTASEGTVVNSATTDGSGSLTVDFTAPAAPAAVSVTATAGNWTLDIPLAVVALPEVCTVVLSAADDVIYATGAGGVIGATTLTVGCFDADGEAVPAGIEVDFEIVAGPGGGECFHPSGEQQQMAFTDANGEVVATLQAGTIAGTVEVMASAGTAEMSTMVTVLTSVRKIDFLAIPMELSVIEVGKVDQAILQATCKLGNNTPAPGGVEVTFTLDSGPGGGETLLAGEGGVLSVVALTDGFGVARASLRSGTISGPLEVSANAGDASETLRLGISSGPPTGMYCAAEQSEDDPSLWFLTATVHDRYHNPAPDSTIVVFLGDSGLISTDNGRGSAPTEGGIARAQFISYSTSGVAHIDCMTDSAVVCELDIDLSPYTEEPGIIARIELDLSLPEIAVHETGGAEQCQVIATCYDIDNQPVGRDREVEFKVTAGPGGGEELLGFGWGPVTVLTNNASQAVVTLGSGTISGTVRVQASAGSALGTASALVTITAGPPAQISVGLNPLNIRGWDVIGASAGVTAYVSDIYNNPVREGTVVWFTCDEGMVRGDYIFQEVLGTGLTEGGIALGTYYSGDPRDDGIVVISVSTAGGEVVGTGSLISSGPPYSMEFLSPTEPVTVLADGSSKLAFVVEVLDINQNYVVSGTPVSYETDLGTCSVGGQTADGIYGSIAMGEFISAVLGMDHSVTTPDDGVGGYAHVTAGAGLGNGVSDELVVTMRTGSSYRQNCEIDCATSVSRGSALPFDVIIEDRYGNPLGGHVLSVTCSPNGPALTPANPVTDQWGSVSMMFTPTANDSGSVTIIVEDLDPVYGGARVTQAITVN